MSGAQEPGIQVPFFHPREVILLQGPDSFVLAGQTDAPFSLCIEYPGGECCTAIMPEDLVAVSAPEGGAIEPALMLLSLVRDYHTPLVVLPREHPGSRRLRYVVSAGSPIHLSCGIRRGTHPDQHLLCSGADLAGMILESQRGAMRLFNPPPSLQVRKLEASLQVTFKP